MTKQYKELLTKILEEGTTKKDRTGTRRKRVFWVSNAFDLQNSLMTIKFHLDN